MKWRVSTTEAEARPHPAPAAEAKTVQTAPAQRPATPIGQSCRLSRPGSRCENLHRWHRRSVPAKALRRMG